MHPAASAYARAVTDAGMGRDWRWGVDVGVAVLLGGLSFAMALPPPAGTLSEYPQPGLAAALLMGGAGASLVMRRTRPTTSFVLALGLMTACAALLGPYQSGSSVLVAVVATYSAAAYGVRPLLIAAVCVVFAVVDATRSWPDMVGSVVFVTTLLVVVGAAGLLARRLRAASAVETARRELVSKESEALLRSAVDDERARVARELHDILSHSLGVVVLQTGAAEHAWDSDPERARQSVAAARATSLEAIEQLRTLLAVVRDAPGMDRSPVPSLADLEPLAARTTAAGFRVDVEVVGVPREVAPQVQASVFRVTQEGISNALKHSGCAGCRVRLEYLTDSVVVEVVDEGSGRMSGPGTRSGLAGVRERVALFGGTVEAGPAPSGGWRLRAGLPG